MTGSTPSGHSVSPTVKSAIDAILEVAQTGTNLAGEVWATVQVNRYRVPDNPDASYVHSIFDTFERLARAHFPELIDDLNAKAAARSEAQDTQRSEGQHINPTGDE